MKSASPELIALLASNEYRLADLYTITLSSGTVLRYTSADVPIVYAGNTFVAVPIARSRTRTVIGVEVDTMDISVHPTAAMLVNGNPFLQSVYSGAFDGAIVKLERAFMAAWGNTTPGVLHQFEGSVSDTDLDGITARIKVRSLLELLNIKMPRNVYQATCCNSLYDTACGASRAAYAVNGTATGGSILNVTSGLGQASGHFDQGVIKFNSGANAGVSRTVKSFAGGEFALSVPLALPVASGDTFTAWPGCDKTLATCTAKFSNASKYRGFPWIPVPETAY